MADPTANLTRRGELLRAVLRGEEVGDVSQAKMEWLCHELAHMVPRRELRAHHALDDSYRVALLGEPVL